MANVSSFSLKIAGEVAYTDETSGPFEATYANGLISNPYSTPTLANFAQLYTDESSSVDDLQALLTNGAPGGRYINFTVTTQLPDKTVKDWWMEISGLVSYDDNTSGGFCVQYENGIFNDVDGKDNFYALLSTSGNRSIINSVLQTISSSSMVDD